MSMGRRVLYVEDNAANLALVTKVLNHVGYAVEGAVDGEEGLDKLAASPPDLVLVDLDLPGIDGFEVIRRIKASSAHGGLPVIAISASVMKQERDQAMAAGCIAFIEKPFDIGELRVAVDEAITGVTPSQH
ncbi:MAG: response regulator [Myxococcota bacterium]